MTTRRVALGMLSATGLLPMLPRMAVATDLEVSIRVMAPPLAVAPMGVFFEAVHHSPVATTRQGGVAFAPAYRPAFHEISYVWSLPDEGPVQTPEHLVDAHRRTDRAMGPFIARVFNTPGQHRIVLEAFAPDGRRGRAEAFVDVLDPDRAFGPDGTIVVAADGDFAGAPPHHTRNAVRDIATAVVRYDALAADRVQIVFKRGQTFQLPTGGGVRFRAQRAHCHLGAWGQGVRPVIDMSRSDANFCVLHPDWDGHALVLRDLHFRGGWDPTTELWQSVPQGAIVATRGDAALLLHNCQEEGCSMTVNSRPPKQPGRFRAMTFFNEYEKTDFKDFLLLGPRDDVDVAITGCRVVQNPLALNGGENRAVTSYGRYGRNSHNFIRCSARRLYVASNDIFIRHGWALNKIFDNPAFRLNRNDVPDMGVVIARNHIEGMMVRASKRGAVPMNLLIEQNYIVSNPSAARAVVFQGGAASLRNNIILEHDTPKFRGTGTGFQCFVKLAWDGKNKTTRDMPFFVYNNSFILLRNDQNTPHGPGTVINEDDGFTSVVEVNNLLWAPALSADPTGDGPLDTTSLAWDARYLGARLGWARLRDVPLPRQMFPGDSVLIPYWKDFFGTQLGQSDFKGEAGRHVIVLPLKGKKNKQAFEGLTGDAGFQFLPEGVQVTNLSAKRWPEGAEFTLHCDRGRTPTAMQTKFGHPPGTLSLYQPLPGSGAWQSAAADLVASYDFLGRLRPGTTHPDASGGQPSRGAVEP